MIVRANVVQLEIGWLVPKNGSGKMINKVGCSSHGVRPIGEGYAWVIEKGDTSLGNVTIPKFWNSIMFRCVGLEWCDDLYHDCLEKGED